MALSTTMLDDSYTYMKAAAGDIAVLAAGDADFIPTIRSLQSRGIRVRVVSWSHAVSHELRDTADEFRSLDAHFDYLTHAVEAA